MNNTHTAQLIKLLCKNKNISVSRLLEECNIRKSLIYDLEKRDYTPSAEVLEKIADYLDCSVDYLLGRTDCPEVARNPAPATESTIKIAAKGRGAHVIEMDPEQLKALKKALAELPLE